MSNEALAWYASVTSHNPQLDAALLQLRPIIGTLEFYELDAGYGQQRSFRVYDNNGPTENWMFYLVHRGPPIHVNCSPAIPTEKCNDKDFLMKVLMDCAAALRGFIEMSGEQHA